MSEENRRVLRMLGQTSGFNWNDVSAEQFIDIFESQRRFNDAGAANAQHRAEQAYRQMNAWLTDNTTRFKEALLDEAESARETLVSESAETLLNQLQFLAASIVSGVCNVAIGLALGWVCGHAAIGAVVAEVASEVLHVDLRF